MKPYYQDDEVTFYQGDCLTVLQTIPTASIDAVCTDPPYGLEFMGKDWDAPWKDAPGGAPSAGVGFQQWCEQWAAECLRVLKPGGHLLAFGGTRMWHRLAAAVEDCGFEIRDSIAWMYGSGFPKSRNVTESMEGWLAGQPLDPAQVLIHPEVYEVTAFLRAARDASGFTNRRIDELFGTNGMAGHWTTGASQPAVPSVRQWEILKAAIGFGDDMDTLVASLGSTERPEPTGERPGDDRRFLDTLGRDNDAPPARGWGTALKPAFEPIVVARKPTRGSASANIRAYGTGGLNIDGCRLPMSDEDRVKYESGAAAFAEMSERRGERLHDGTVRKSAQVYGDYGNVTSIPNDLGRWPTNVTLDEGQAEELDRTSGQASRFFYVPKPTAAEKPQLDGQGHPTVKPVDLMRWLVRLVTPPPGASSRAVPGIRHDRGGLRRRRLPVHRDRTRPDLHRPGGASRV